MNEWITHRGLVGAELELAGGSGPPNLRQRADSLHWSVRGAPLPAGARRRALVVQWIRRPPPKR